MTPEISPESVYRALAAWRKSKAPEGRRRMLDTEPVLTDLPFMRSAAPSERYARFIDGLNLAVGQLDAPEFVQSVLTATLLRDGDIGLVSQRLREVGDELRKQGFDLTDKMLEHREYEGLKNLAAMLASNDFAGHFGKVTEVSLPDLTRDDSRAILSSVVGQRQPVSEVTIDITLRDDLTNSDRFILTYRNCLVGPIPDYAVAIVSSPELVDHILARYPKIIDVWSTGGLPIPETVPAFISTATLVSRPVNLNGVGDPVHHRLSRVDNAGAKKYVGDLLTAYPEIQVFACDIPLGSTGKARVHAEFSIGAKKDRHCCYWIAEGAMFVQRITVDYSLFTFGDGPCLVRVFPFMANVDTASRHDKSAKRFEAMIDNWLVKGQGVMVVWSNDER